MSTQNKHVVGLTSAEIASLWSTYLNDTMVLCFLKFLLKDTEDEEVKPLISKAIDQAQKRINELKNIFQKEKFPIPNGYSDEDLNLNAPPLFFNLFPLSFIYAMSTIGVNVFAMLLSNVARQDVRDFFTQSVTSTTELYNQSVNLMLKKGIYDRPTMIPYPDHVEYISKKEDFLSKWLEPQRPLNVLELSEMFYIVERNYFANILLTAFIQIVKDEEVKRHFLKGMELTKSQIALINNKLEKEELQGVIMVNAEVTTSTVSPFSDRLMMSFISMINSLAISFLGKAISYSQRIDLVGEYMKIMGEVIKYSKEGMDIMIKRRWLEEPPHAPNRKELFHH